MKTNVPTLKIIFQYAPDDKPCFNLVRTEILVKPRGIKFGTQINNKQNLPQKAILQLM